jgi:manganese-dependent ADP-ribose/CDP-alcohol diphosphatase
MDTSGGTSMLKKILVVLALLGAVFAGSACHRAVRFGVVADCQYYSGPSLATRYYRQSLAKLKESLGQFNKENVDFVINLGDTIDRNFESFAAVLPLFRELKAPVYHVLGNHDFNVDAADQHKILPQLRMKKGYYAFSGGKWRFLVLDGFELRIPFPEEEPIRGEAEALYLRLRAEGKSNALKWNGGISRKQLDFLETELEKSERSDQPVIVFCHFPVLPEASYNLWNDEELVALLERYRCVKAYFSGHNHAGDYVLRNRIHYLTFQGMVETADSNAFAVVTLENETIVVKGFGREPDRALKIY